jgi:chemotaxis signal transduction protein
VKIEDRVRALKREFDAGFAAPPREGREASEDFLALGLGGDAYAIRLADVAALVARPAPTPLPSRRPACLGLVGNGGSAAALFSLPLLLGLPASAAPRWMALLREANDVGLGFERYEGYARVALADIVPLGEGTRRLYVTRSARHGGVTRLIIDIPAIVNDLSA